MSNKTGQLQGGYETWEVIPGFITARGGAVSVYDIPGPNAGAAWIDSAPDAHRKYVNTCNEKPSKGAAKALARLLKAWKYYRDVPVSSFYLEMRCAQHVAKQSTYIHVWDVCQVLETLEDMWLASLNDPSAASGRIHACSTDTKKADALSKLSTAAGRARKALDAHLRDEPATAFRYLDLLFGGHFPAR